MIQLQTRVRIIDNSGGMIGQCIKVLKPHGRNYAKVGDIILVSIKEIVMAKLNSSSKGKSNVTSIRDANKVKRGTMFKALVVRTKVNNNIFKFGKFEDNAVILLKSSGMPSKGIAAGNKKPKLDELPPIGTRVKGPMSQQIQKNIKISTLSKNIY